MDTQSIDLMGFITRESARPLFSPFTWKGRKFSCDGLSTYSPAPQPHHGDGTLQHRHIIATMTYV